jgi:hypothetical protein
MIEKGFFLQRGPCRRSRAGRGPKTKANNEQEELHTCGGLFEEQWTEER